MVHIDLTYIENRAAPTATCNLEIANVFCLNVHVWKNCVKIIIFFYGK